MEAVSIVVASIAFAVSVQALLAVAVLSALVAALLFSVPPALVGWLAGRMVTVEASPAPSVS